jgi:two-component system, NarL family, sensor histidine kinase DesK
MRDGTPGTADMTPGTADMTAPTATMVQGPGRVSAEPTPASTAWIADQNKWAHGWRRVVFPAIFLTYLIQVGSAVPGNTNALGTVVGFAIIVAFAVGYLMVVPAGWQCDDRKYGVLLAALTVLFVAELPFAHADALVMGVFISAVAVVKYGERGFALAIGFMALAIVLPAVVPSWHGTFTTGFDNGTAIAIPMATLAMFAFGRVVRGNRQLIDARVEIARLASENERSRIARDLHDLLGHSLTTITVKAELAQRLSLRDAEAAAREIAEVEALSRRALSDVRAAVANYREVTLSGELATGKEVLRAAGIAAELPPAVDVVDNATQELFGWVVREGVTNIVRHSRAASCTVSISPSSVEIVDDGIGHIGGGSGSGLSGLAERVAAAGGVIEAGPVAPAGWRLAVRLAGSGS